MMPGIEWPDVCRRVRAARHDALFYCILLTVRDGSGNVAAGLDAGADDYLVKPFDPDELRARIDVGLRILELEQSLASRVRELEEALGRIRRLEGLLPICGWCKRIRDEGQEWRTVEEYVGGRSDVSFSHGICPACEARVMSETDLD